REEERLKISPVQHRKVARINGHGINLSWPAAIDLRDRPCFIRTSGRPNLHLACVNSRRSGNTENDIEQRRIFGDLRTGSVAGRPRAVSGMLMVFGSGMLMV